MGIVMSTCLPYMLPRLIYCFMSLGLPTHKKNPNCLFLWDILQTLREFYPKRDSQITKGGSVSICHCVIMVRSWGDIRTSLGFYRPIARYLIIGTQSNQVFSRFKVMLGHWDVLVNLVINNWLIIIGTQSNQVFSRFKAMLGHWDVLVNLVINFYSNFDAGKKRKGFH